MVFANRLPQLPSHSISEDSALTPPGSLGLFSGLTLLAWVLVYFLVEETRQLSLEDLQNVFSQSKRTFVENNYFRLGYLGRRYLLRDMSAQDPLAAAQRDEDEEEYSPHPFASGSFEMSRRRVSSGGATARTQRDSAAASPRGSAESLPRDGPNNPH